MTSDSGHLLVASSPELLHMPTPETMPSGTLKSRAAVPASACFMNEPHISAAFPLPTTPYPEYLISLRASSPIQTAATMSGVKPTNQASVLLSAVPVFPAAGLPIFARLPVPSAELMTPFIMSAMIYAVFSSSTISLSGPCDSRTIPLASRTSEMT
jgi:hypothetical protein